MAITVPPELDALFLSLVGEKFLQADEDAAHRKSEPYDQMRREVLKLRARLESTAVKARRALPGRGAHEFGAALQSILAHLEDFADQLLELAEAMIRLAVEIREAKWSLIAELVRLSIELALLLGLSGFAGPATAAESVLARQRTRLALLIILSDVLERVHLLPSFAGAVAEAFQTLVVRLAMLALNPVDQRPDGIDGTAIAFSALYGGLAGGLAHPLSHVFKGVTDAVGKAPWYVGGGFPGLPDAQGGGSARPALTPGGDAAGAPDGRADLPDGLLFEAGQFAAAGTTDSLAVIVAGGIFFGTWSTTGENFVGAGLSERFAHHAETLATRSPEGALLALTPPLPAQTGPGSRVAVEPTAGPGAAASVRTSEEVGPAVAFSAASSYREPAPSAQRDGSALASSTAPGSWLPGPERPSVTDGMPTPPTTTLRPGPPGPGTPGATDRTGSPVPTAPTPWSGRAGPTPVGTSNHGISLAEEVRPGRLGHGTFLPELSRHATDDGSTHTWSSDARADQLRGDSVGNPPGPAEPNLAPYSPEPVRAPDHAPDAEESVAPAHPEPAGAHHHAYPGPDNTASLPGRDISTSPGSGAMSATGLPEASDRVEAPEPAASKPADLESEPVPEFLSPDSPANYASAPAPAPVSGQPPGDGDGSLADGDRGGSAARPPGDAVLRFGTRHDGAVELAHITPVPQATVEWLRDRIAQLAGDSDTPDPSLRAAVSQVLSTRRLTAEWARLLGSSGLPLSIPHRGRIHHVSLRLELQLTGPSPQRLDPMPDGPPVGVQRWAFGLDETGDTGGSGDLREFAHPFSHTWAVGKSLLHHISLTSHPTLTYNQLTTSATVGRAVQPMVLLRSRGRHWPFDYAMTWELRREAAGPSPGVSPGTAPGVPSGVPAALGWERAAAPAPDRLTVWFPTYLAVAEGLPEADPTRPETVPAPLERLLDEVPLFGPKALADHDVVLADVLNAFGAPLAFLSDHSRRELSEFFGEGNQRGNLPQAWGGCVATPTLYTTSGETIGYLRISAQLTGGDVITGSTTAGSVLETYVLRSLRTQGSAEIANAAGLRLSVALGLATGPSDSVSGVEPVGVRLALQAGAEHRFTHVLNSGGSARIAHSLRTATPLLHVTPQVRLQVTLVRPDAAPLPPAAGSSLADGGGYPVEMLVPSLDTLGHVPSRSRYLPPEVLHLRQLGVSTTPLEVSGTGPLFDQAERWLRDSGFLPPDTPDPQAWDKAASRAVRAQRLTNARKLDAVRSRLSLRSALDEMVEGGVLTWFELPTGFGTRRVGVRLVTERRYFGHDAESGVEHRRSLPKVQTLNYTGSSFAGDEQFHSTPLAWTIGGDVTVTNPLGGGERRLRRVRPQYAYTSRTTTVTDSGAGTGHEYYLLSPTEDGVQVFSVPVTHRLEILDSHGPEHEPHIAVGSVRLAVPTYRTLDHASSAPRPAEARDHLPRDDRSLALPASGRTVQDGVLRLPETAWLDRVGGSADLRRETLALLGALEREAARHAEQAGPPPMPGGWVEDEPNDLEAPDVATASAPAAATASAPGGDSGLLPLLWSAGSFLGGALGGWTAGVGRWVWRAAVGDPVTASGAPAHEVLDTALSPHHLSANALRIFRDTYVVEGSSAPGALFGTDATVEVRGYLTDVRVLPQPPKLDAERWLQSADASARAENRQWDHQSGLSLEGRYGGTDSGAFAPRGGAHADVSHTDGVTVNDNTGVFRVTTEDTTPAYRFTATAHYVVTVRSGARNVVVGTLVPGLGGLNRTRVVDVPEGVEFLLVDNDLQNHPDLAALVAEAGQATADAGPPDQRLPWWYVDSGGTIGAGAVTEVHADRGRDAFQRRIHHLVEQEAPGVTTPGHAAYVPGVLTRVNEHATSLGLRALVNAGPRGRTTFHFVHRSWLGPRMIEVALAARPADCLDLPTVHGRRVTATSGMDNVFGHSHGDGTNLRVPGATRTSSGRTVGGRLDFSPACERGGEWAAPALSLARQGTRVDAQTSSRELRSWQRTFGETAEFRVPYLYEVRVSSRPLTESLLGTLLDMIGNGLNVAKDAFVLPHARAAELSAPATGRLGEEPAITVLRFNASETPAEGERRAEHVRPSVLTGDPIRQRPGPEPGSVNVEMELAQDLRDLLSGPAWAPTRPIQVYDFGAAEEFREALCAVDPTLRDPSSPVTSTSTEGMLIRLTTLAQSGLSTSLEPAAVASFLGRPGGPGLSARLALYAPRVELTTKDTAIDRIELSADGFQTQADTTVTTSLGYGHSSRYVVDDRGGPVVPVTGDRAMLGQNAMTSSQRRELLRLGTPMTNAAGEGLVGHRVRAVAVLEVRGPQDMRWVVGDIVLRTTETPPTAARDGLPPSELRPASTAPAPDGRDERQLLPTAPIRPLTQTVLTALSGSVTNVGADTHPDSARRTPSLPRTVSSGT
ncbi:hypothetical protein [Streptomyces zaomyceticus]|uniref:hypothetical protein n=1 Tax=Streptomyces zaomyceticus TaxID=68286 RepID=UPI0036956D68